MKKLLENFIAIVLCIFIINHISFARTYEEFREEDYEFEKRLSVKKLEQLDIVRNTQNRWNENSPISRRDLLKIIHIVKKGDRKYHISPKNDNGLELLERVKDSLNQDMKNTEFNDIQKNTNDDYFITSLVVNDLFLGKKTDKGYVADLDSYATYEEALTAVGRLFLNSKDLSMYYLNIYENIDDKSHPYYEFAEDISLINSKSPLDISSPQIDESILSEHIPAYELLHIVYRALYIPTIKIGDFNSTINFHYIDQFKKADNKLDEYEDIID